MRPILPIALIVLVMGCKKDEPGTETGLTGPIAPYDPLVYVDPRVGTGGIGAQVTGVSPGASWPFGMTLVGPDTRNSKYGAPGFYHFGGYHWDDDQIDGFSHTHSHGMGVNDYGGVLLMPRAHWDPAYTTDEGRTAPFEHGREEATAGRYAVDLLDDGTTVEIVATEHGAHHRYGFAAGTDPIVLVDLGHTLGDIDIDAADLEVDLGAGAIRGYQLLVGSYSGRFGGVQTWFEARFDPAPVASGAWSDPAAPTDGATTATGSTAGAWVAFPAGTTQVDVRVALSYVDAAGAAANLEAELPDFDLDARRAAVETAWRDKLDGVRVRGGTTADLRAFHSAHYHTMLMPSRLSDVDGRYRGVDQAIHTADRPHYSDFSLWDTFRTTHPWLTLTQPATTTDLILSLERMTRDGGSVPRWPLAHGYTGGMVGTPAEQLFAGAWLKGVQDWDPTFLLDACVAASTGPQADASRSGVTGWVDRGWVAFEDAGTPASLNLEYAWSDHATSLWAADLGRADDAALLADLADNWANTWDPDAGFFRGRHADGSFDPWDPDDVFDWTGDFVEGNAWHYVWYVPWDVDGMIAVQHGGDRDAFLARLGDYWEQVYAETDDAGPDDWYWHGNEPVLHYAALGSLAGDSALSAESARWILANRYDDTEEGLDGNDDAGTLSAWYLFNAIGLYPVAGTPTYAVTSPIFERVEIDRPDGTIVLRAPGAGPTAIYVSGVDVDGAPLAAPVLSHDQLVSGDVLFHMASNRDDAMR